MWPGDGRHPRRIAGPRLQWPDLQTTGVRLHDPGHGPRPAVHRHDPDALHRRRPEGELRAPGGPDGRGPDGLRPVDPLPAPRPDAARLAEPRPVRAERRAREHAALLAPPPDRLRGLARGPRVVPAVGQHHARPPGIRPDPGRRGDDRAARPGLRQRGRDGHRRATAGRGIQPPRAHDRRPPDLRHRLGRRPPGGHRVGGGQPRRPSPAEPAHRPVRRQPHPARRADEHGLVGGRASSDSRPTAGTPSGSRTATTSPRSRPRSRRP